MSIDYEGAAEDQIASADLGKVSEVAEKQIQLQQKKERLEEQLKTINEDLNILKHEVLPEAMLEANLAELTLNSGAKVTVKPFYSLSIADKTNREPAFKWLEDHDAGDIIKVTVSVPFSPAEIEQALTLSAQLQEVGHDVIVDKNVHPMTLKSWLKNNVELVDEIPQDLFRVFVGQVANIK